VYWAPQAAPPQHIDLADARALYTKVSQEILEKEQQVIFRLPDRGFSRFILPFLPHFNQ
jgi:hypothetical protein